MYHGKTAEYLLIYVASIVFQSGTCNYNNDLKSPGSFKQSKAKARFSSCSCPCEQMRLCSPSFPFPGSRLKKQFPSEIMVGWGKNKTPGIETSDASSRFCLAYVIPSSIHSTMDNNNSNGQT